MAAPSVTSGHSTSSAAGSQHALHFTEKQELVFEVLEHLDRVCKVDALVVEGESAMQVDGVARHLRDAKVFGKEVACLELCRIPVALDRVVHPARQVALAGAAVAAGLVTVSSTAASPGVQRRRPVWRIRFRQG